jgi:selenocysteine lyase/cysteine desulfurase
MDIQQLLRDETLRRHEFPVCASKIFLAHAGVSPLPRRVAEAMQRYLDAASSQDQEDVLADTFLDDTRRQAARLIGAHKDEIAFTGSTSMGLAMVAAGLDWRAGDNVVCYREDYPANVYPWMALAARGVEVRFVETQHYGKVTVEDVARVVDERTRLVSLASVHFVSGWRLDVDAMGQFLRGRGILFCLDAIQSFGALRTSMRHVDFAAADAHKWLLGPLGTAILCVRREHFERLRPVLVGWHTAACPDWIAQDTLRLKPDARRYEPGSLNVAGIVGLRAALGLIEEVGIEAIEARVLALAGQVIAGVTARGYETVGANGGVGVSGGVSFTRAGADLNTMHVKLVQQNIITSLRRLRDGRRCLRVSAHFYNSEREIEQLIAQV